MKISNSRICPIMIPDRFIYRQTDAFPGKVLLGRNRPVYDQNVSQYFITQNYKGKTDRSHVSCIIVTVQYSIFGYSLFLFIDHFSDETFTLLLN
jgi:hypothetical protein